MRKRFQIIVALIIIFTLFSTDAIIPLHAGKQTDELPYATDHIIVKFKEGTSTLEAQDVNRKFGVSPGKIFPIRIFR
jgi:hypothetical protein